MQGRGLKAERQPWGTWYVEYPYKWEHSPEITTTRVKAFRTRCEAQEFIRVRRVGVMT